MQRVVFEEPVGVYIGNNCNLSCEQCVTFSNFNFKKWFKWQENSDAYYTWSLKVDFKNIYVFGGEPYANPELRMWCRELKDLWPESNFWILTNGTYLKNNIDLTKELIDMGYVIQVSCKDEKFFQEVTELIPDLINDYSTSRNEDSRSRPYTNSYITTYHNDKRILMEVYEDFYFLSSSVKEIKDGVLHFYNTDAELTHSKCPMIPCNVLLNGFLYKCSFMASFSEARYQFEFEKSAYKLLKKYKPGNPYSDISEIAQFLKNLKNPIDQCSLCNYADMDIESSIIKISPREPKIKLSKQISR